MRPRQGKPKRSERKIFHHFLSTMMDAEMESNRQMGCRPLTWGTGRSNGGNHNKKNGGFTRCTKVAFDRVRGPETM